MLRNAESYLDSTLARHPIAHGLLGFRAGLLWALAWLVPTLIGAYLLNPACLLIFLAACALETTYCALWRVSPLRAVVSGAVKTTGPLAAVLAVDPKPSLSFLAILVLCLFLWKVGGQNIPHDWKDIEEDRQMGARTIPIALGVEVSVKLVLVALTGAVALTPILLRLGKQMFSPVYLAGAVAIGVHLLLVPAYRLYRTKTREQSMALFNRASFYPPAVLALVIIATL